MIALVGMYEVWNLLLGFPHCFSAALSRVGVLSKCRVLLMSGVNVGDIDCVPPAQFIAFDICHLTATILWTDAEPIS